MGQKRFKNWIKRRAKKRKAAAKSASPVIVNILEEAFAFPVHTHVDVGSRESRCYAAVLGDCKGSISREHYISENILKQFDGGIPSTGIPWIKGEAKNLSSNDLVTKCLCEHHNSALSPLDSFAGKLFEEMSTGSLRPRVLVQAEGRLLELWMLKALLGALCTGKFEMKGKTFTKADISEQWVRTLFEGLPLDDGLGLYMRYSVGDRIEFGKRITLAPVFLNGEVSGLRLQFGGIEFILSLKPKEANFNLQHPSSRNLMLHPRRINHVNGIGGIEFVWR